MATKKSTSIRRRARRSRKPESIEIVKEQLVLAIVGIKAVADIVSRVSGPSQRITLKNHVIKPLDAMLEQLGETQLASAIEGAA